VKLVAALLVAVGFAGGAQAARLPDTTNGVHVFSDQLPDGLSPGLLHFAATHYAGAQKLGLTETRALKRIDPSFFMIQYRLALGLGYRTSIRFGDAWQREWPPSPQARWFALWHGRRVQSSWGWYLTNPDDASWRSYYIGQLRRQIRSTGADGAFLDSASIPNEFGGSTFSPRLADYDPAFESEWRQKLERWLPAVQRALGVPVIANAGELDTTRDHTDYSHIAGIMVEGFAFPGDGQWFAPADWQLQADRILALERTGRIVIGQAYPAEDDVQARMFALATYLLVNSGHTFLNFGEGIRVSWFPEYGVDLGSPAGPLPASAAALRDAHGAFVRRYARGLALVNPGEGTITERLPAGYARVVPSGGGTVPADGVLPAAWSLDTEPVQTLTLGPHDGAVLVRSGT
jgi:Hypothetical glycosyl hydrolase family 15